MALGRPSWSRWIAVGIVAVFAELALFDLLSFAVGARVAYGHDAGAHLAATFRVHAMRFDWFKIVDWSAQSPDQDYHHAPLGYLAASLVLATGWLRPLASIYAAKALWLLVLVAALYGAGTRLGRSPWAGLTAVAMGGLNPIVLSAARAVDLDLAAMAAVALGIWGYALTQGFTRRWASAAAGALVGLGLLVKTTPAAFLGPFYAAAFFFPADPAEKGRPGRGRNLFWCGFAAFAVAGLYYLPLADRFLSPGYLGASFGPKDLAAKLAGIGGESLSFLFAPLHVVLLLAALVVGGKRRDPFFAPLLVAAAAGLAFVCAISDFNLTYLYPFRVLYAVALARALGLLAARWRAPLALALAALYLWPVAAPGAAARFNAYPSTWLVYRRLTQEPSEYAIWHPGRPEESRQSATRRADHARRLARDARVDEAFVAAVCAVYVKSESRHCPVLLAPKPYDRAGAAPWGPVEGIEHVLATRYAGVPCREVGVLAPSKWAGLALTALVAARPDQELAERRDLLRIPVLTGNDDANQRRALALRPLVVVIRPDPDPDAADRAAALRELERDHRVDLDARFDEAAPSGAPRYRVLFLTANGFRPAPAGGGP